MLAAAPIESAQARRWSCYLRHMRCRRRVALLSILVACGGGAGGGTDAVTDVSGGSSPGDGPSIDASSGVLREIYVKASYTGNGYGRFGSVAVSGDGNTMVVGASSESSRTTTIDGDQTDSSAPFNGAAYVFVRSGGTWVQQAYLKAFNGVSMLGFGDNVAISDDGNVVAVTGPHENSGGGSSGAVYLFHRTGSTWAQHGLVKASNAELQDYFGASVALSGDGHTLAVGAWGESSAATTIGGNQADNSAAMAGAAYVFTGSAGTWTQQAYIKPSNSRAALYFGNGVALSGDGNALAVGAPGDRSGATGIDGDPTDTSKALSGAAFVFTRTGTTWTQAHYVKPAVTKVGARFGFAVAMSRDATTLVVSALYDDSAATGIDGNASNTAAPNSGAAYVFARSGSTWAQQAYVKASNTDTSDRFSESIALSGDGRRLIIGAGGEDSSATGLGGDQADNTATTSGAAYLYERTGNTWAQLAYIKASNSQMDDLFGSTNVRQVIGISHTGATFAIGAVGEDGGSVGINGIKNESAVESGAVYVFE